MTSQFLAAAASVALIGAGFAGVGTRSIEAMPGIQTAFTDGNGDGADNLCRVDVVRSGKAGSADITRHELDSGQCVCVVTTGPANSNGSAENIVSGLLRERTCSDAPLAAKGGSGTIILTILGVAAAGGLAAALGSDSHG